MYFQGCQGYQKTAVLIPYFNNKAHVRNFEIQKTNLGGSIPVQEDGNREQG
jgi:hypothetical protein